MFRGSAKDVKGHFAASKTINATIFENYNLFGTSCTKDLSREFAITFVIIQMLF
jgi:hypothetical protein